VIEPISNIDVVTFVLLRCFIYLLIMERADVPPVKMKEIIAKLFQKIEMVNQPCNKPPSSSQQKNFWTTRSAAKLSTKNRF